MPGSDVVVHVEPADGTDLRERVYAAAAAVPGVREIHNVSLVDVGGRNELSLHVKLPGEMSLAEAHDVAEQLEAAILGAVPSVDSVQTHLEPLTGDLAGQEVTGDAAAVERIVSDVTGSRPRELRFLRTDAGVVAYLTLGLDGDDEPRRRPCACERDRGADPRRGAGDRRRGRAHGARQA